MHSIHCFYFRILLSVALLYPIFSNSCLAQSTGMLVSASLIRTVGTNELNTILTTKKDEFASPHTTNYAVPSYPSALYPVEIYKLIYTSRIPEQKNRRTVASAMIALPKIGEASPGYPKSPKLISYQHGTIFGKYQCPSYAFATNNPETRGMYWDGGFEDRLVTAVFSGQGDVVIAPDYFGMGDSSEKEGFMVKASYQQACLDCYLAASSFLGSKGIRPSALFLSGWSLGGGVTFYFLEKLEELGYPVTAASTASAPPDWLALMNALIYNPRSIQAPWANILLILSAFSYERYYSQPGLAKELLNPLYYEQCKQVYERKGTNSLDQTYLIITGTNSLGASGVPIPSDFWDLVQPKYHDPLNLASSLYGKDLDRNQTSRWFSYTPLRTYYGELDEVGSASIGQLAQRYNEAIGNTNVTALPVTEGNHRGTFLQAVSEQRNWFNSFSGTP